MLSWIDGVKEVRVNPAIGSITVIYDRDETTEKILMQALEEKKIISRQTINKNDPFFAKVVSEAGEKAGKAILGHVVKQALNANGLSLLAALI